MKKNYSPAPWRACHDGNCHCGLVWSTAIDSLVAFTPDANDNEFGEGCKIQPKSTEFFANMRLIAAAPELLEALEAMLMIFNTPRFNQRFNKMQKDVMAQAEEIVRKAHDGTPTSDKCDCGEVCNCDTQEVEITEDMEKFGLFVYHMLFHINSMIDFKEPESVRKAYERWLKGVRDTKSYPPEL